MFFRPIDDDIKLSLSIPQYAIELFELTDNNRTFLKQWLPWLDGIKEPLDTKKFLERQLLRFQRLEALHTTIFYQNQIAGVLGYNQIDRANNIGHIGYWLGQEYNGKGIMTKSVRDLIEVGFNYYCIERIDIRCAVENSRSRAIPERLSFRKEGIIRQAEKLSDKYVDHVVYGLLKNEYTSNTGIITN
ncbi:Ribosomal-protein-serine acetyltransferase [Hyella patelloides LEGE 07179]|uniref:Ribosomal-protein-serine acetyltransferase n=1 Tax=Hyella patelloides LEGE 07179 TaxID=945734 RepID=A0A563VJK0_9CYAN|nr:GNAT family N-acetyltransferase [Hyella patelloides]VEP11582.1 Ribosomal-protein-serine acetyltransferase [Hyella patelloides LEGE 07179]